MIEILKHLFGFCGEGHHNLLWLLSTIPLSSFVFYNINMIKLIFTYLKNLLGFR